MTGVYPHLTRAFLSTVVEDKDGYPYPISPFAGVMAVKPEMLNEICQFSIEQTVFSDVTLIVTFESAGGQLAAAVGQALNLPYLIARKKKFKLPHEISFAVSTNYDEKTFYLYGDVKGEKILIIDDVIASGTTMKNSVLALEKAGATVTALFAIAGKINSIGKRYQDVLATVETPLLTIVQIKIVDDKVVII